MSLSYKIFDLIKEFAVRIWKSPYIYDLGNGPQRAWNFIAKDKMPILILSAMSIINGTI